MTNMTIFKFLEYSCLQIWNADDGKVNVIDRICTCSKLIFQPESNGKSKTHRTKTVNQNKKSRAETTKSQKQTKENRKICEITYSIRIEGKTNRSGDFWVKIDPKSALWQEEKEEERVTVRVLFFIINRLNFEIIIKN